jgi:hypothetical protein
MKFGYLLGLARTACAVSAMALAASSVSAQGVDKALRATATPPSLASLKAAAKSGAALNPSVLGSFSSDLVYTAVTPCRIVDTRNAVGAFTAGQARTFDLDGLGGPATTYAQQGGVGTSCNIPYGKVTAAAMTITVTETTGPGFITAWGLGTQPLTSVLNWVAGQTIANTTIVPIVPNSGTDFSIYSYSGAHVIIDVVGYYAAPSAISIAAPIRMGSETGTTQRPTALGGSSAENAYAGTVTRRIVSTLTGAGSIVAASPDMTLERNGYDGGFQIRVLPNSTSNPPFKLAVRGTFVRANGTTGSILYEVTSPSTAGVLTQLLADTENAVYITLTFGNFFSLGNITEVTLSRATGDYYWVGSVISSYNQ